MKLLTYILTPLFVIAMSSFISPLTTVPFTIFDFNSKSDVSSWKIVNDDVMGGVSSSSFRLKDEVGLFKGNVSTANYGGFASVRYRMNPADVKHFNAIKLTIKGDGKDYQFRLKHKTSDYYSFIQTFSTSGEWQTITLNLNEFYPSFRGRKLDIPNFNKNSITEISFLIANKKNEAFELQIDKIELVNK